MPHWRTSACRPPACTPPRASQLLRTKPTRRDKKDVFKNINRDADLCSQVSILCPLVEIWNTLNTGSAVARGNPVGYNWVLVLQDYLDIRYQQPTQKNTFEWTGVM